MEGGVWVRGKGKVKGGDKGTLDWWRRFEWIGGRPCRQEDGCGWDVGFRCLE